MKRKVIVAYAVYKTVECEVNVPETEDAPFEDFQPIQEAIEKEEGRGVEWEICGLYDKKTNETYFE